MKNNPYRPEIVGAFVLSVIVLSLETWRRWGELLSPAALDDFLVFGCAMIVAVLLGRRVPDAPTLWVFVCGGAWFMMCLSVWGSIYRFDEGDPSGVPVPGVIAFKLVGLALISVAARRGLRRLRLPDPYG